LLLLLVPASTASVCSLDCQHDAPCVSGHADFSDHPVDPADNSQALDFHSATQDENGMHCACPHGWTGLECTVPFETCDGQHPCYFGGECIPGLADQYGNEQLYCDCSNAWDDDGNSYTGKYCEIRVSSEEEEHTFCDGGSGDDDLMYCVNDGECNLDYP